MGTRVSISPFARRLAVIAVVALVGRLIYVHFELHFLLLTDEAWYIGMARKLFTAQRWTSIFPPAGPTAQHGPLTSVIVAPFAWLWPNATEGLRNVMAVVGTSTVVMMGLAGREAGGENVGLIAAGLAAVMPDFWIRDGLVASEPVAALVVVSAVFVALRYRQRVTIGAAVAMGALCGLVALARPEIAPVLIVITALMVVRHSSGRAVLNGAVALLAAVVLVAPWTIYNQSRFPRAVIVSNNLGITLAGANCSLTYYSWSYIGYDTPICWNAAQAAANKVSADESVQSAVMRHAGLSYAVHHWTRLPLVASMRVVWFLGLYRPGWVVHMGTLGGQPAWATWTQAIAFYFIFPAAMALWWLNRRRPWPHLLLALLVANSFLVVVLFVGHWRYRVTLDVAMVLILALAAGQWWDRRRIENDAGRADSAADVTVTPSSSA